MKKLRFYKEYDNNDVRRWYVDLPEWTGSKAELEMVAGADSMLEYMSNIGDNIWLNISTIEFDGSDKVMFVRLGEEDMGSGAWYNMDYYKGESIELEMWLCDVMKFVFGGFPKTIFISKAE